ncbi:hypothetical protein FRB95_011406 [Tulasnella sp. JGI-2019a]|nr:hypothetical protein FRB95_011406 [Tulasnella sp. JGI-2019a]
MQSSQRSAHESGKIHRATLATRGNVAQVSTTPGPANAKSLKLPISASTFQSQSKQKSVVLDAAQSGIAAHPTDQGRKDIQDIEEIRMQMSKMLSQKIPKSATAAPPNLRHNGAKVGQSSRAQDHETPAITIPSSTDLPMPAAQLATSSTWTCTICHRMMSSASRRAHENGKSHRVKLVQGNALAQNPVTPAGSSSRLNRTGPSTPRNKPPYAPPATSTNPRPRNFVQWTCIVCGISMQLQNKAAHLNGSAHQHAQRNHDHGGGGDGGSSGDSSGDDSFGGSIRDREYRKYRDEQDELLGLLHDIDTQWGLLPEGGAYKESNHYFGPGIHDYY